MDELLNELNRKILAANQTRPLTDQFSKLNTDEDRVIFVLKLMTEYEIIPSIKCLLKSDEKSTKLRENANRTFIAGKDHKAVIEYTESIAYAMNSSGGLALAYANRSAALFRIKNYEACMSDIDRVLTLEYPSKLKTKLYERKGLCLLALGRSDSKSSFQEALKWLDQTSLSEDQTNNLKKRLENFMSAPLAMVEVPDDQISCEAPKLWRTNPEIPCASDFLAVEYSNDFGRHVVAARDIKVGELLAVEKPYSVLLAPENIYSHCSFCLEVSWAMIPCEQCVHAMYCSVACKDKAWNTSHRVECEVSGILLNLEMSILSLFSLRLAVVATEQGKCIATLKQEIAELERTTADPRIKGFSADGKLHSDEYRSIYSLVTNTDKRSSADLFGRALNAACMVYIASRNSDIFGERLTLSPAALVEIADVTFVGGLVMRHQQIIPNNIHTFHELRGMEPEERGAAAMPFYSLINHSCDPNIVRQCFSDCMVIYSLYPIKKGEQIFDNYGPHYALQDRSWRKAKLLRQFHFDCCCLPCIEDWPLYHRIPTYEYQPISVRQKNAISRVLRKHDRYVELCIQGDIEEEPMMLFDLLGMVAILYQHVKRPCQDLNNVTETVKRVYALRGNRFDVPV